MMSYALVFVSLLQGAVESKDGPPAPPPPAPAPAPSSSSSSVGPPLTSLDVELRPRAKPKTPKKLRQHKVAWVPPPNAGTPLVLVFAGAHAAMVPASAASARAFAFEPGAPVQSAWPAASTPWLARDVDGDGKITSGRELFGSFTRLDGGDGDARGARGDPRGTRLADNGFTALAAVDDNHDGVVDARDPAFASLLLWRDDGDEISQPGELVPLVQAGVTSLDVAYTADRTYAGVAGVREVERAGFTFVDAHGADKRGAVVDVHLKMTPLPPAPPQS